MHIEFLLEGLKGINFLGDLGLSRWESNVDTSPAEAGREGAGCIYLVLVGVHWRAFVGAAMYLRVPRMAGKLLATERPSASQEHLCCMKLETKHN
jgi:hypothetical protein